MYECLSKGLEFAKYVLLILFFVLTIECNAYLCRESRYFSDTLHCQFLRKITEPPDEFGHPCIIGLKDKSFEIMKGFVVLFHFFFFQADKKGAVFARFSLSSIVKNRIECQLL